MFENWHVTSKRDLAALVFAGRHYTHRGQNGLDFLPPGESLVLVSNEFDAAFAWWRTKFPWNSLLGWYCALFRNEGPTLSSELILEAEMVLVTFHVDAARCPDGMLTYVEDAKVRSTNPGCCFKKAGWRRIGRSADGLKTLLQKPFELAGVGECQR